MKKMSLAVLWLLMLQPGCKPPPTYHVQRQVSIQELGICLAYQSDVRVPYQVRLEFDKTLQAFIQKYNAEPHPFKLTTCQHPDTMSLRLNVYETRLVSSDQQTAGVLVSLAGLATPFILASAGAPLILTFWYFPHDVSPVESSLSPDIRAGMTPVSLTNLTNSGFLRSPEKQVVKHGEAFERFLRYHVGEVEKAYRKAQKPLAKP